MKNPNEFYTAQRPNKALVFAASLFGAPAEEPPFSIPRYSRFGLTLFDKGEKGTSILFANIPAQDIFLIKRKTDLAVDRMSQAPVMPAQTSEIGAAAAGKAFSVPLMDNNFRGKTPGQVLQENPANASELHRIREWLQANVAKYPRNRDQIEAIDDALSAAQDGAPQVVETVQPVVQGFEIYSSDHKYLASRKDEQGNPLVYQVSILFEPRNTKSPVSVRIVNYHAPVIIQKGKRSEIRQSAATDRISATFNLTMDEWYAAASFGEQLFRSFIATNFPQQYADVQSRSFKNAAE